jgi:hypothetical protein
MRFAEPDGNGPKGKYLRLRTQSFFPEITDRQGYNSCATLIDLVNVPPHWVFDSVVSSI